MNTECSFRRAAKQGRQLTKETAKALDNRESATLGVHPPPRYIGTCQLTAADRCPPPLVFDVFADDDNRLVHDCHKSVSWWPKEVEHCT